MNMEEPHQPCTGATGCLLPVPARGEEDTGGLTARVAPHTHEDYLIALVLILIGADVDLLAAVAV